MGALFAWLFLIPETGSDAMIWVVALISAAGAVISQVGDLSASAIKRNHDIKDYGKIIPGHGGIMDRFDSVLFTAPVIWLATTKAAACIILAAGIPDQAHGDTA